VKTLRSKFLPSETISRCVVGHVAEDATWRSPGGQLAALDRPPQPLLELGGKLVLGEPIEHLSILSRVVICQRLAAIPHAYLASQLTDRAASRSHRRGDRSLRRAGLPGLRKPRVTGSYQSMVTFPPRGVESARTLVSARGGRGRGCPRGAMMVLVAEDRVEELGEQRGVDQGEADYDYR
jgi:hypothetical protein